MRFLFPIFGGLPYLIYWLSRSKATVFLQVENGKVVVAGVEWLIKLQEAQSEAYAERQRQIKEQGFLKVMWPELVASLALMGLWIYLMKTYL